MQDNIEITPFVGSDGKYHFIYKTTNLINNKEYIGKHSTNNINDNYYGSGTALKRAIEKYGIENFAVEILSYHETEFDALNEEARIIDEDYIERDDTYNQTLGGRGSWYHTKGIIGVVDKHGNAYRVPNDDPRYLSGELVHITAYKTTVKDKDGNNLQVSINDPRYLSGELVGIAKNKANVKDKDGNKFQVDKDDPRYLSGELVGVEKNTITVKDKEGNKFRVPMDDPRYLSGELVGVTKGIGVYNDKNGTRVFTYVDDPRVISGELFKLVPKKRFKIPHKCEPRKCPHCGKEGRGRAMTRWHFDRCKFKSFD